MNHGSTVHSERGSVSLFVVLLLPVLVLFAGLVLDGGRQLQARRDALAAAASSARAAIQMTPAEATRGLDTSLAAGRARAELSRRRIRRRGSRQWRRRARDSARIDQLRDPSRGCVGCGKCPGERARRRRAGERTVTRRFVVALFALAVLLITCAGVPAFLVLLVGNPWPGRDAVDLGDTEALTVAVLATMTWTVWARFVVAVLIEATEQIACIRRRVTTAWAASEGADSPPPVSRSVAGLAAHWMVAAVFMLLPSACALPVASAPPPLVQVVAVSADANVPEMMIVSPRRSARCRHRNGFAACRRSTRRLSRRARRTSSR